MESSDISNDLYFFASHSGGGSGSYFDDLIYLEKGDIVFIDESGIRKIFVIEDLFYIYKNGYFDVSYSSKGDVLFLFTCSVKYNDKQLVVRAKLINKH